MGFNFWMRFSWRCPLHKTPLLGRRVWWKRVQRPPFHQNVRSREGVCWGLAEELDVGLVEDDVFP
jgi:hypothetical protein